MLQILTHKSETLLDKIGDWNPQLLRELKCRFNQRNVAFVTTLGIIAQGLFIVFFRGFLPPDPLDPEIVKSVNSYGNFNRYCIGSPPPNWQGYNENYPIPNNFCVSDLLGHTVINYQLWWLDIFVTLSIVGSIVLLVTGTFLLINDLAKEESRGTLNFIRLSPQPARTIFIGKLLGVPGLLYWLAAITIPLHLVSGLLAGISFPLIFAFYAVLMAGCAFFYHLALAVGLVTAKLVVMQSFASSGCLLFLLFISSMVSLWSNHSMFHSPLDWLQLFNPIQALTYLVQSTFLPFTTVQYFQDQVLTTLHWYGLSLFATPVFGLGFMVLNYGIWTYALSRVINLRFRSPNNVFLAKSQSYGLTLAFLVLGLGFISSGANQNELLYLNFIILQGLLFIFMAILAIAITPDRSILLNWARYHHQQASVKRTITYNYLWAENSPATAAIAVNLGICFLYLSPSILIFNLGEYRLSVFTGLVVGLTAILFYAVIYQRLLLLKTKQRYLFALAIVSLFVIAPLILAIIYSSRFYQLSSIWFITFLPIIAGEKASPVYALMTVLGQWTAILLTGAEMKAKLHQLGRSETQQLTSLEQRFKQIKA